MIDRACLNCGKTFQVPYPSSHRVNCSSACSTARRRLPRRTRADKGIRKTEWETRTCAGCGSEFAIPQWEAKLTGPRARHHCSSNCRKQPPICKMPGCERPTQARNLCRFHYDAWLLERPGEREKKAAYARVYRQRNLAKVRADEWRRNLKRRGLTPETWEALFVSQGGGCAVCGDSESSNGHRLVVDHCHKGGEIRGLLCHGCNRALGLFGDDPARLRAAAEYLEAT